MEERIPKASFLQWGSSLERVLWAEGSGQLMGTGTETSMTPNTKEEVMWFREKPKERDMGKKLAVWLQTRGQAFCLPPKRASF